MIFQAFFSTIVIRSMKKILFIWMIPLSLMLFSCDPVKNDQENTSNSLQNSSADQKKENPSGKVSAKNKQSELAFRKVNDSNFPFDTRFPDNWENMMEIKTATIISTKPAVADEKLTRVIKIDAQMGSQKFDKVKGEMVVTPPLYRDQARKYLEKLKRTCDDLKVLDSGAEMLGGEKARYILCQFKRKSDQLLVETRSLIGASKQMNYILSYSYPSGEFNEEDELIWQNAWKNFKFISR